MGVEVKTKRNPQKTNWIIDAGLFVGLLVACVLDLTGLELHQWLGLAVAAFAAYHLIVHWKWVDAVTKRFFGKTSGEARLYYVVDVGLAVGFVAILVTGLVISTWLDLTLDNYLLWRDAHIVATVATVALTVAKIGFHWKWVVQVSKRSIFRTATPAPAAVRVEGRPVAATASRRDFLRLMGGVSALALMATKPGLETWLGSASESLDAASAAPLPSQEPALAAAPVATATAASATATVPTAAGRTASTAAQPTTRAATAPAASATRPAPAAPAATATPAAPLASAGACPARCPKNRHCSYPGQCRLYTDANRNGRCDLGECV